MPIKSFMSAEKVIPCFWKVQIHPLMTIQIMYVYVSQNWNGLFGLKFDRESNLSPNQWPFSSTNSTINSIYSSLPQYFLWQKGVQETRYFLGRSHDPDLTPAPKPSESPRFYHYSKNASVKLKISCKNVARTSRFTQAKCGLLDPNYSVEDVLHDYK